MNANVRRAAVVALVTTAGVASLGGVAAARAGSASAARASLKRGPAGSRFYTPPRKLPAGRHGTLIWERPYHGVDALRGAKNYLVLYKQVGIRGKMVAVSGVVSVPNTKTPKHGWPVASFAHGTTGIGDACAPSRATGRTSTPARSDLGYNRLLNAWIKDGYAVTRTDYEGLGTPGVHPFLIGRSEGYGVLDIVRAAHQLDPAITERAIISGHSQGGHAALWAASLAPKYTPELHVLGTLAFAPQSHTAEEASFLRTVSSTSLSSFAALIFRGLDVGYPSLQVQSLFTPEASKLYPQTLTKCLDALGSPSSFGGLPLDQFVTQSANLTPALNEIARNDPDNLKIKGPILLEQGSSDTTVVPAFDQALSQSLAKAGDKVTYHTYAGATHSGVLVAAGADARRFLKARAHR